LIQRFVVSHTVSTHLHLTVFGPPQITRADGTAITFRSLKHLALLIYLALNPECIDLMRKEPMHRLQTDQPQ
jgi:hypothetical protein